MANEPTSASSTLGGTRFQALRPLGKGGLGEVYVAHDGDFQREVALKEIRADRADDPHSQRLFAREAAITGRLEHPGIVPMYGRGVRADGSPYYAMRLIGGQNLKAAIDRFHVGWVSNPSEKAKESHGRVGNPSYDSLAFRNLLGRFVAVCNAIEYAHSRGVVHRDLKPENVMLGAFGETLVIDWGLAKVFDPAAFQCAASLREAPQCSPHAPREESISRSEMPTLANSPVDAEASTQTFLAAGTSNEERKPPDSAPQPASAPAFDTTLSHSPAPAETPDPAFAEDNFATRLGDVKGTFAYMSPEQAAGDIPKIGPASDIFSLGATLYAMLVGKPRSFSVNSHEVAIQEIIAGRLTSPREANAAANIPPALEAICLKAMSLRLEARFFSAKALTEDIERYLADEPVSARSEPISLKARRWLRKHPRTVASLAATLLVGLASSIAIASVVAQNAKIIAGKNQALTTANSSLDESNRNLDTSNAQLLGKNEELQKSNAAETQAKEDALAVIGFFQNNVLARARPETQAGGLGIAATIRAAIDASEPDIAAAFTGRPLVEASLRNTLGSTYHYLGEAELAIAQHESARTLREAKLGPEHPDTLTSMGNLALAYQSAGKLELSLPLHEETLKLRRATQGPEHPATLTSMNNLATAYQSAGKLDLALPLLEETLKLKRAKLGPEHPATLTAMNNLAFVYQSVGKLELALPLLEQSLEMTKAKLGPEHPSTLVSMNNLANAYMSVGKLEQALPLQEQTLEMMKAKLGPDHPNTLNSMNNLALAYKSAGKLEQALPLYEETLELIRGKLGPEHPETLASMNNLAQAYQSVGKLDQALPLLEQSLELMKARLGPEHPNTLGVMNNLAMAYKSAGKLEQALPLLEQSLELMKAKLGPDHPNTLSSMNNLALAYEFVGKLDQALPLHEQTLEMMKAKLGPEHPNTLTSMYNLADAYLQSGPSEKALPLINDFITQKRKRVKPDDSGFAGLLAHVSTKLLKHRQYAAAETYLREHLAIMVKNMPFDWHTFSAKSVLGGALAGQKKFEEAEPLLLAGYEGLKQRQGKVFPGAKEGLTDALQRLVDLYTAWEKPDEAAKWRKELEGAGAVGDDADEAITATEFQITPTKATVGFRP